MKSITNSLNSEILELYNPKMLSYHLIKQMIYKFDHPNLETDILGTYEKALKSLNNEKRILNKLGYN